MKVGAVQRVNPVRVITLAHGHVGMALAYLQHMKTSVVDESVDRVKYTL